MTLNEITTLLASQFKRELDVPFKLMLAARVHYWRARLIRNSVDKDAKDRKFFTQTIFVPMVLSKDSPNCTMYCGCPIRRTAVPVPVPIRANNVLFDYVGAVNGQSPFLELVPGFVEAMLGNSIYLKGLPGYTLENAHVEVFNATEIPMLRITGIFENPEAAALLNCAQGNTVDCNFWEKDYPCAADILQMVIQSILTVDYQIGQVPATEEIPVNEQLEQVKPQR